MGVLYKYQASMPTSCYWTGSYKTTSRDLLLDYMASLASYLQEIAKDQLWNSWTNGKEWRNRLDSPPLSKVPLEELDDNLSRKLDYCCIIFDFENTTNDEKDILTKEAILEDICDYISEKGSTMSTSMQVDIMQMVIKNIFRDLPPAPPPEEIPDDEPLTSVDPGWPHLNLVYQAALKILEHPYFHPSILKEVINKDFITNIFKLFSSPDPRERDFLNLRSFIRSSMKHIFLTIIHDQIDMFGVTELLEVTGAIIKGLAVPLKPEHLQLLQKVLIPLLSAPGYLSFSAQLSYCLVTLISKDPSVAVPAVKGLIRHWPHTDSARQVQVLSQMEALLPVIPREQFLAVQTEFYNRVGQSVASQHFQVSERALHMWSNKIFTEHIRDSITATLPLLYPYIYRCKQHHWNEKVIQLSEEVLEIMDNIDQEFVD